MTTTSLRFPVTAMRSVARNSGHLAEMPGEIAADVEARVFHRRVEAALEAARAHAELDALADAPVLAVHEGPEFHDVLRVETGLPDFRLVEQELAGDARDVGRPRPEREGGNVLRCRREQQVRVDEFAFVVSLLGL